MPSASSLPYWEAEVALPPTSFWNSGSSCRQSRSESLAAQFGLPYPAAKAFLSVSSASCFSAEDAVGAGGVVERVRIARAKRDGGLQVTDAFVGVLFQVGEVGGEQNAGANIFWHKLELLAEDLDHAIAHLLRFFFAAQPLERVE